MVKSNNKKNMSNKKQVLIFGASSNMAEKFIENNLKEYSFHLFTTKKNKISKKYKLYNNIKVYDAKSIEKSKRYFVNIKYDFLMTFNGFFKRHNIFDKKIFNINFLLIQKILEYNCLSYIKGKRNIRVIIVSSLDSVYPNKNSINYSSSKAALSHLIKNYQHLHKNQSIQYTDIQPGAVKTNMRKRKSGHSLDPHEISNLISFLLSLDAKTTIPKVELFPKNNFYFGY